VSRFFVGVDDTVVTDKNRQLGIIYVITKIIGEKIKRQSTAPEWRWNPFRRSRVIDCDWRENSDNPYVAEKQNYPGDMLRLSQLPVSARRRTSRVGKAYG
jgi:hypothetical protein